MVPSPLIECLFRTALAEAELEYREDHISMACYVRFPLVGRQKEYLLVWTTTPWTVPANQAVAINEQFSYVRVRVHTGHTYIVQADRVTSIFEEDKVLSSSLSPPGAPPVSMGQDERMLEVTPITVEELLSLRYTHPWDDTTDLPVLAAPFVTADTGSGLVHLAPAYGTEDYAVARGAGIQPREIGTNIYGLGNPCITHCDENYYHCYSE